MGIGPTNPTSAPRLGEINLAEAGVSRWINRARQRRIQTGPLRQRVNDFADAVAEVRRLAGAGMRSGSGSGVLWR